MSPHRPFGFAKSPLPPQAGEDRFSPHPFTGEVAAQRSEGGITQVRLGEKISRKRARFLRRNMTKAETILWTRLRRKQLGGHKFRRQHPIGPYIADFVCTAEKLVLEVDGWTHSSETERKHDAKRTEFMETLGWRVIRVENEDVYDAEGPTLDFILAELADRGEN